MTESSFLNLIQKKNVVFITVKNKDYIRVSQIERLLEKEASSYRIYSSEKGNPITRTLDLKRRLPSIDFSGADVIILGFLPQLLWGKVKKAIFSDAKELSSGQKPVLVADFFLSLYDTVVLDRKLVKDGYRIAMLLRKLDKRVLEDASLILTDTKANSDFLSSLYGIPKEKFEAMYLEADKSLYDAALLEKRKAPVDVDRVVQEISSLGCEEAEKEPVKRSEYRVLYFGTGLPLQGTDTVLEAFGMVAGSGIKCSFIGSLKGVHGSILRACRNNPDIEIISWLSQKELAVKIAEADLCIAGHFNLYIDKAARTIPGKAYIYEVMEKPMILGDTKANHELFCADDAHIFVPRGDAAALCEAIIKQAEKEGLNYGR